MVNLEILDRALQKENNFRIHNHIQIREPKQLLRFTADSEHTSPEQSHFTPHRKHLTGCFSYYAQLFMCAFGPAGRQSANT